MKSCGLMLLAVSLFASTFLVNTISTGGPGGRWLKELGPLRARAWTPARVGKPVKPVKPVQTKFSKTPGVFMTQCAIYVIEILVDAERREGD